MITVVSRKSSMLYDTLRVIARNEAIQENRIKLEHLGVTTDYTDETDCGHNN